MSGGAADPVDFTDIVGGHGPWQLAFFLYVAMSCFPQAFHNLIMTFFAPNVEHWCARPPEVISANISDAVWKNFSIPIVLSPSTSAGYERDSCHYNNFSIVNGSLQYQFPIGENLVPCKSWEYDLSSYKSTLVDEFDMVCDREWLISVSKTIYMFGYIVADVVCCQLSDRYGRRPVLLVSLCVFLIPAHLTLLSTNFLMFAVLRFIMSIGVTGAFTVAYVMMTEVIGTKYRTAYGFTFNIGWVVAYMILPGIAWLVPEWFWLQLAITLPWISLLCAYWLIPETPRWLLTHGKFAEAEVLLLQAAKKNGKDVKTAKAEISRFIEQLSKTPDKEDESDVTVIDLFRTPTLRRNTLNMYFNWFIISYIYYALSYNTNDLGGNPYITFFIAGAVEMPAAIIFLYISKIIGHRTALMIANILSGLFLLIIIPVPPDMSWLVITFSMIGKFFIAASFDTVYIYSAELFPTVVRNIGVGTSSVWARIGALVAPFIKQLADVTHPSVPLAVPAFLCILSAFLLFLSPETKNRKIPDTLEEGENCWKK